MTHDMHKKAGWYQLSSLLSSRIMKTFKTLHSQDWSCQLLALHICKWECFHVFVTWASSQYGEFCWPRFTAVVEFRICMMIPDKIFSWFSLIHYLINYCGSATSAIAECKHAIAQAIFAKNSYTCTTSKITVPKTCCKLHWYSTTYSSFSHKPLGNM